MPVVRTNLADNPAPGSITGWAASSPLTLTTFTNGNPCVQATAPAAATGYVFSDSALGTFVEGEVITLSMDVEFPDGYPGITVRAHSRAGNAYYNTGMVSLPPTPPNAGVYRVSVTLPLPAGVPVNDLDLSVVSSGTIAIGIRHQYGQLLIERSPSALPYFDGGTLGTPYLVNSWTGAAHASTSVASTYSYLPAEYPDALSASRRCVWFGTTSRMTWLPMPSSGMAVSTNANVESGIYENGGGWGFRSAGSHRQYAFEFGPREASGVNGLDKYNQYASGYYASFAQTPGGRGTNYMLFADPAIFDQNVLPPHWASPALALAGDSWHHIGPYSSRAATPANTYDQPPATLTYSVDASTHLASMLNPRRRVIIPIPPTHRLSFGWSGTRTGSAGIGYSLYNHGGTITDVATPVAPINNGTLPGRIGTLEVSGQTAYAVEIYLKGTAAAQTISITSMMAELIPLWEPTRADGHSAGQHVAGKGHTGCMFADDAIVESYEMIDTYSGRSVHLKGLSTTLKEVGAWGAVA